MLKRVIVILLLSNTAAIAQERLTLDDAIDKALQHNFDIRISRLIAEQAEVNNTAGNAGMLPSINANAGVTAGSANTNIEFADGRVQEVNNAASVSYNAAATLNWTLFDGGRMFIVKKQLNELEDIEKIRLKEQVQYIVSQTVQAYAQVVLQRQQAIAVDTGLALAKVRMSLTSLQYESGMSAKVDYLQARVDYNTRRRDSLDLRAGLATAFANLNALMGDESDNEYIVDDSLALDMTLEPTDKELLKGINPTLDIARRNAYVSELNARIAKTFHLPTLALNGGYNYNRTQSQAGFALFNQSYGPSGGLNISLPIFNGGNINRQSKVASLQSMRDQLLFSKQNTELGRQYRIAWSNYEVAIAAYNLEQENVSYAKENADIQQARFKVGISTTVETREAENSYVQALVRYYSAAFSLKVNETRVLELEGKLVK